MFYWLTGIAMFLAALVLLQSMRAEKRAHQTKLDAIRKRIQANEQHREQRNITNNKKHNGPTEESL